MMGLAAECAKRPFNSCAEFPAGGAKEQVFFREQSYAALFTEYGEAEVFEGKAPTHGDSFLRIEFFVKKRKDFVSVW